MQANSAPMLHELRLFFIALQFLTRVPVPGWVGWRAEWMHASARHFPAVGLLVGGVGALMLWAAAHLWPAPVAVALSMAATVWLTGAFHEDGLADTCDGLGGAVGRERALAIMKDSRIGTYGAVGLLLVLGLKATALHALALRDLHAALLALPLAHALSRAVPVALLWWLPYAGDAEHAKAKPMAQQASAATLLVAAGWCAAALATVLALGWRERDVLVMVLAAAATAVLMARWLRARLGGYTGDTLGAAQQAAEVAAYLALVASMAQG
jgi:adenosylcobinamide-GDP ribazoletransferase